jgi:hypothetical protein
MRIKKIESPKLHYDETLLTIVFAKGQGKEVAQFYANNIIDPEKDYTVKIEPVKRKRSLNSNAYAWVLMTEIANVLRTDKEDVYVEMLKRYGQIAEDGEGNKIVFSVRSDIDVTKFYRYLERIGTGTVNGTEFTHYRALKGSSEFDTKEMSIFIDGIVSEAKNLGIETMTPDEIARMNASWGC